VNLRTKGIVMRRSLISLWLIALMSNAFAADYELPVLRGSTPFVPAPPVYTRWSGYYVGGQLSGSIAGGDFASSVGSLVSYAVRNSVLESHVSNWTTLPKGDMHGVGFGGFVGYNSQWDEVTLGVEANYTHSSLSKSASDSLSRSFLDNTGAPAGHEYTYDATVAASASVKLTDFATFRARAGWVAGDFMPYGFAGFAVGRVDITRSATVTATRTDSFNIVVTDPVTGLTATVPQSITTNVALPGPQTQTQTGAYALGFAGGLGLDVLVKSNMFVRGEWEYVQFPNIKYTNVSINTVRLGAGAKF
jgi:outer membrane immunogenic protein